METNPRLCYEALRSRDARFDGRFFTAVLTTGIYCRPICPARTPRESNVKFYSVAAAAEQAGFRPCRRCRPEAAPGSSAWTGTTATVSRSLRLIEDGVLDDCGLEELAERVGVGARHLRRLFDEEIGAAPVQVAQTRRAHFARSLLFETALPVGEIASEAGFGSVRRFNEVMKRTFGRSPRELRRSGAETAGRSDAGDLRLRIPYRTPYGWDSIARFLAPRAIPGVEIVENGCYRRTVTTSAGRKSSPAAAALLEVRRVPGSSHLELRIDPPLAGSLLAAVTRVRRLFDCHADPREIGSFLAEDPLLAPLVARRPGLRVPGAWDGFEVAVRVILGQQVTVAGASTLAGRLVDRFGTPLPRSLRRRAAPLTRLFPSSSVLARADVASIGLPRARAEAVRALAAAVERGELRLDGSSDPEITRERLQSISGIGPWSAAMITMRAQGDTDAFPAGDLVLRRTVAGRDGSLSEKKLLERSKSWSPWRAYAALHLWNSDNDDCEREG